MGGRDNSMSGFSLTIFRALHFSQPFTEHIQPIILTVRLADGLRRPTSQVIRDLYGTFNSPKPISEAMSEGMNDTAF